MSIGRWRSADEPLALRAEATRAMLSTVHLPWSLDLADRARYDCELAWQDLGACSVVECRSAPLSGYRDHADLRRTDGEYFGMLLILAGEEHVRQDDISVRMRAGDMLLWDGTRPLRFEVIRPLHKVTLLVPRKRLGDAMARDEPRGALKLESRSGLGALAAGHLASLARVARDIPAGDAPLAADILVDLLGRIIDPLAEPAAVDLLGRVREHVGHNLADPGLTPSRVAGRFGISTRYLHMLFSTTGETFSSHVRARRLSAMKRDLADRRMTGQSITEIALRWGFADSAHASRAFSAAYGISPSLYRSTRRP